MICNFSEQIKKILRSSLYRENRHDEFGAYEVMEFMFGWMASFLASNSASSTQKRGEWRERDGHNGLKNFWKLHSYIYPSTISRDIDKEFKLQVYEFKVRIFWEGDKILQNLHLTFVYST
jgi:hypothetical protein